MAIADIPQAFLKAYLPDETIMRLEGVLADTMIQIDPEKYGPMATKTSREKTLLFVKLTRALYGNIKASLQFWLQLSKVLLDFGFEPNPYDHCVVNKMIDGKQCTIT